MTLSFSSVVVSASAVILASTIGLSRGASGDPYAILIDGKAIKGDGSECFESPTDQGVIAFVSGSEVDPIVVWDPDAPCPNGGSYIHYAANGSVQDFQPMTAGAGEVVHTYKAAVFGTLPLSEGTSGCQSFDTSSAPVTDVHYVQTWRVARYGSTCPQASNGGVKGGLIFLGVLAVVAIGVVWARRKRWFPRSNKVESYIALATMPPS